MNNLQYLSEQQSLYLLYITQQLLLISISYTKIFLLFLDSRIFVPSFDSLHVKSLEWNKGQTLVLEKIQKNLIKSFLQSSLSYILVQMVHASYCAPYPKWPCVKHEVNIWYPCCITLLCSRTFYSLLLSLVIYVVTTPSNVTDVTLWPITSNPNPRVLKIEKCKIIEMKMKME